VCVLLLEEVIRVCVIEATGVPTVMRSKKNMREFGKFCISGWTDLHVCQSIVEIEGNDMAFKGGKGTLSTNNG